MSNIEQIRVLIVDDHPVLSQGLEALLFDMSDIKVVGTAGDGLDAIDEARRLEPDVVLMDIWMPGMDGAQATAAIRARQPDIKIVAMSGSEDLDKILGILRAGASGYVSKALHQEEFAEAIRQVHRGRVSIPLEISRRLLAGYEKRAPAREALTRREVEILRLLAKGLSNQDIADRAAVSEGTVRSHLTNIFGKLGVENRVEATLFALRDGLTTLEQCFEPPLESLPP